MRPILALNCLLQIEQERSEEGSSVGDALALAFRCACFCSVSLILSQGAYNHSERSATASGRQVHLPWKHIV